MGTAMTTSAIRKKLISFIADADDKKIKGMYMLLAEEIEKEEPFTLSGEHMAILDAEREKHVSGKSKSYSWSQAKQIIRGKKSL
jgi:ATP-dependent exoDNAse (exonuclease V) alpha subunit